MISRVGNATSLLQSACGLVRWYSRRPVAIVNADELNLDPKATDTVPSRRRRRRSSRKHAGESEKVTKEVPKVAETVETLVSKSDKKYQGLKRDDNRLSKLLLNVKTKKRREESDCIILEGKNMIKEGLAAKLEPFAIFFNHTNLIDDLEIPAGTEVYKTSYNSIKLWSNLTTSPGIMGIFRTPDVSNKPPAEGFIPLTFILDNVREPGNLGCILRSAAGVGCERFIVIKKGCVELWQPKVLRSACGAHFKVPISVPSTWEEVPELLSEDCAFYIADSNPGVERSAPTESRQFLATLPVLQWNQVDYTKSEVAIVVTGETVGLSPDAIGVLKSRSKRLNIPLCNEVDSLNTAVAISVIGFEIRRQFLAKYEHLRNITVAE